MRSGDGFMRHDKRFEFSRGNTAVGAFFSAGRLLAALAAGLLLTVAVSSVSAFASDCEGIRRSVLRLHILANSDSEADQALKLYVRDRILELDETIFGSAEDLSGAEENARRALPLIEEAANAALRQRGSGDTAHAELTHMYFTTREYDTFTLPAGYYDAVRVTIGEGKGHNWWCVLYPPLCLPAAESETELSDVLTEEQAAIVSGGERYEFKFAAVELYEEVKLWLQAEE